MARTAYGVHRSETARALHPDLLIRGHFPVDGVLPPPTGPRIVSLADETELGIVLLLDLTTLTTTWLEGAQ